MHLRTLSKSFLVLLCSIGLSLSVTGQQKKKVSVDGLIYDLKHPDVDRRHDAARLLGEHSIRQAVPPLVKLTRDSDHTVRLEAVRALVKIRDTRALPAFVDSTRDPVLAVQEKALEGIVGNYVAEEDGFVPGVKKVFGIVNPFDDDFNPLLVEPYASVNDDAILALSDLLKAQNTGLRRKAAIALGILRAQQALPEIQIALESEDDNGVKVELIRAIYKIGDSQAGEFVIPFIHDSDKKVHDEAIFTVGRLRVHSALTNLKNLYESGVNERRKVLGIPVTGADDLEKKLLEALAHLGDPSCRDIFAAALEDRREVVRRYAAEGLGRVGDSSAIRKIAEKKLREKSAEAQIAMGYALFLLGREEHLLELVDKSDGSGQAYSYLLELTSDQVRQLYPYLNSERNSVKTRLLDVVGLRGSSDALPVADQLSQHEDPDVAGAALLAIRRLRARFGA